MKRTYLISIVIIAIIAITGSAYFVQPPTQTNPSPGTSPTPTPQSTTQTSVILNGAGATFPQPLLNAMITAYGQVKSHVQINYDGVGSGQGISDLESKTVDFAASDAPLGDSDMAKAPNALHIPETIGAVTIAYNLPDVPTGLHLTGNVIADIFLGKITTWNDLEIQSINPTITLPNETIQVARRSDGSGTTFIFTGYLSISSSEWNSTVGQGKTVAWPVGIPASGNPGVANVIQGTPYGVGYVELAYALQNNMTVAAIQNPAGNWVTPTLTSTENAVDSGASAGLPAGDESWSSVSIINAPGEEAYPIVSFTYLLAYKELNVVPGMTQAKATAMVQFLWWVIHDGQGFAPELNYAQLPASVVRINEATIQSITYNGQYLQTN
jgi:phosphate ABC transporter phosphate-binding protein